MKRINSILLIIVVILAFFLNLKVNTIEDNLRLLKSDFSSERVFNNSRISEIYNNVDEKLKQQASLFENVSFEYGLFDKSKMLANLSLSVMPKEITADTKIVVYIGEYSEPVFMELNWGTYEFSANLEVPVSMFFESTLYPRISVCTDGVERVELLRDIDLSNLWKKYLPSLRASLESNEATLHQGKLKVKGNLFLRFDKPDTNINSRFSDLYLITEINGKELETESLSDVLSRMKYYQINEHSYAFEKSYDITQNDTLLIYAVAVDYLGYVHKYVAYEWSLREDGAIPEQVNILYGEQISDKDGNIRYNGKH